jgi:hypothetical protein
MKVMKSGTVVFDAAERFQKMSYRNRYRISGANNSILLTVPLISGREQRLPMADVQIYNDGLWQVQHWRTLVSVYKRTPYFEHYEDLLRPLYEHSYTHLAAFNRASIDWVVKQLKIDLAVEETDLFVKDYGDGVVDLRNEKAANVPLPKYYQVFEDRIGFQPDLSILDLLFSEGPGAGDLLVG